MDDVRGLATPEREGSAADADAGPTDTPATVVKAVVALEEVEDAVGHQGADGDETPLDVVEPTDGQVETPPRQEPFMDGPHRVTLPTGQCGWGQRRSSTYFYGHPIDTFLTSQHQNL